MTRPSIVTLTTDFGAIGPYVAEVKGVILGLVPGVQLVDVSHAIAPQNILEGAFVLAGIVDAFPPGTVHLGVVDPGVGTDRRLIAVAVADQWFVLPDNGLVSAVVRGRNVAGIWEIANPAIRRSPVSSTFHGRDILAPAAAHLLHGGDPAELGPARTKIHTLRNIEATRDENGFVGEVVLRDAFGNLITNIDGDAVNATPPESWDVEVAGTRIHGLSRTYGEHGSGKLIALVGSTRRLEVSVVNGDAAALLTAGPGTTVWLRKKFES